MQSVSMSACAWMHKNRRGNYPYTSVICLHSLIGTLMFAMHYADYTDDRHHMIYRVFQKNLSEVSMMIICKYHLQAVQVQKCRNVRFDEKLGHLSSRDLCISFNNIELVLQNISYTTLVILQLQSDTVCFRLIFANILNSPKYQSLIKLEPFYMKMVHNRSLLYHYLFIYLVWEKEGNMWTMFKGHFEKSMIEGRLLQRCYNMPLNKNQEIIHTG